MAESGGSSRGSGRPSPGAPAPGERRTRKRGGLLTSLQDAIFGAVRWLTGHVRSVWTALGLFLGGGLILSAAALAFFSWIASAMAGGATQRFDQSVVELMRRNAAPLWDWLALAGAGLGSGIAMWVVLIIGTVLLWRSRHHFSVLLLWVSFLGGRVLNEELKATFARSRPEPIDWEVEVFGRSVGFPESFSFPSGHATTAMVVFGTVAYLIARLEPTARQRRWTLGGAAALIVLVGWSRVYMGVHYPSDVVAGYLAGFLWATLVVLAIEVVRHFATFRPELAAEEKDVEKGVEPLREAAHPGED